MERAAHPKYTCFKFLFLFSPLSLFIICNQSVSFRMIKFFETSVLSVTLLYTVIARDKVPKQSHYEIPRFARNDKAVKLFNLICCGHVLIRTLPYTFEIADDD